MKNFNIILLAFIALSCNIEKKNQAASITDLSDIKKWEESFKIDSVAVTQVVLSMHDAVTNRDLRDSLTFNQWTDFFTSDLLYGQSEGKPAIEMGKVGFKPIREAFRDIKINYDKIIIDHVFASCDLAYVSYHYDATVTTIKTNEIQDISRSALAILRKNKAAAWKVAYQSFN
jgi:ketosteroid isomerase-like protein